MVGERPANDEAHDVSRSGVGGSENVGTSNHKSDEIFGPPKVQGFLGNVVQPRVRRT